MGDCAFAVTLFTSYSPKKECLCMFTYRKITRLKQSELVLPTCNKVFLSFGVVHICCATCCTITRFPGTSDARLSFEEVLCMFLKCK